MDSLSYFNVTAQQVATHPVGLLKLETSLNASVDPNAFVQIHDAVSTPANGAVPVKSWPCAETQYKEFKRGELRLVNGLYVCLSSTHATKTLSVGANDTMTVLSAELYGPERISGTTIAGDLTTARPFLTLGPSTPVRLHRIQVKDVATLSVPHWLLLYANGAPTGPTRYVWPLIPNSGQIILDLDFGVAGMDVLQDGLSSLVAYTSATPANAATLGEHVAIKIEYQVL